MGVLLALAAGSTAGALPVVFAGVGQALTRARGHLLGALLLGTLGGPLLAGLDAGLDSAADDGVGAVLGGLLVLLEPRPRHPGRQELDLLSTADPAPLLRRRGSDRPGERLVELKERAGLRRGGAPGWYRRLRRGLVVPPAGGRMLVQADRAAAAGATLALELPFAGAGDARPDPARRKVMPAWVMTSTRRAPRPCWCSPRRFSNPEPSAKCWICRQFAGA
jgi:hypothetical protein